MLAHCPNRKSPTKTLNVTLSWHKYTRADARNSNTHKGGPRKQREQLAGCCDGGVGRASASTSTGRMSNDGCVGSGVRVGWWSGV